MTPVDGKPILWASKIAPARPGDGTKGADRSTGEANSPGRLTSRIKAEQ